MLLSIVTLVKNRDRAKMTSRGHPALAAVREVEKFDRMEHRDRCAARDLRDAADVAGGGEIGRGLHDIRNLAVAQPQGDLAGALKSYEADLAIAERLAKSDLGNAGWQRDLSVSYSKLATVYRRSRT
jgi:hypothetical protein